MSGDSLTFRVSIPTDEGFVGRSCNNPNCKRYFKVHIDTIRTPMYCPYCGDSFPVDQLMTKNQVGYLREVAEEKARKLVFDECDQVFGRLAGRYPRTDPVHFEHKPIRYREKAIRPSYSEDEVDSELVCPECGFRFQVYGIFGYCPGCRTENLLIYDANVGIIEQEITLSANPRRALRHAYSDLVSTFECFCAKKANMLGQQAKGGRFQSLSWTRKYFRKNLSIDVFASLDSKAWLTLRRVFGKRHACLHNKGQANEQYVRMVPEDRELLGKEVRMSIEDFRIATGLLREVLDTLPMRITGT